MQARLTGIFAAAFFILAATLSFGVSTPVYAQQIKPLEIEPDENGVDMLSGQTSTRVPPLAVPGAGRLQYDKMSDILPFLTGVVPPGQYANYQINGGRATSESMTCLDGECTSTKRNGSTLLEALGSREFFFFEGHTGKEIVFDQEQFWHVQQSGLKVVFYPSVVKYADGEQHTFTYDTYTVSYPGFYNITYHRPSKITSTNGYELRFTYQSNTGNTTTWRTVATAGIYQGSTSTTPLAQYTYNGTTVTDLAQRSWVCGGCNFIIDEPAQVSATSMQLPGETALAYEATALTSASTTTKPVGQVTTDGVTWNYSYQGLRNDANDATRIRFDELTVTGPLGTERTVDISHPPGDTGAGKIDSITNSLGQTTYYEHDNFRRLTKITFDEGNSVEVTYDFLGNITERRTRAKPGSGQADLVETADYPPPPGAPTCTMACFLPNWTRDALNNQTDYTWHSTGQLLTQLDPPDENNIRRKTINSYDAFGRLTRTELCEAEINGTELTCGTANSFVTTWTYWGSTRLPATETVKDGANNGPLTTSYTYDAAGRRTSVDGPLPGSEDATYARYDIVGRKVWEIGPQGEDGYRPATFTEYRNADGQVERVKTGYVSGTTTHETPLTLTFVNVISDTETDYNSRRLAIETTVSDGSGTVFSVTQMSYDALNRSDCTAVRLDLVNIPANACDAASPAGADGADRISRQHYDTESRVVRIEQGVDTNLVRDYATYTFTPNGQIASMTDARGYKASMMYDGFDRQTHWYFPNPTTPGAINSNDYEQYGYDANGNRTSLRKRDGSVITYEYDNLNRVTRKTIPDTRPELHADHTRDVFYEYDIRGLQLHARFGSDSGVGTTSVYDRYGRMTSVTDNTSGTARTLQSQYLPDGSRWELKFPDNQAFRFYYWPGGQFNHMTAPLGELLVDYNYTHRGELEEVVRDAAAPKQQWGYDAIGRMTSNLIDAPSASYDVTWSYTRNPASQIKSETQTNDSFSWDGFVAVDRPYVTNGLNQYTSVSGQTYCYDDNGNLTADGQYVYLYDVENRLVEMRAIPPNPVCNNLAYTGEIKAELRYDPLGRLYQIENFIGGVGQGARTMLYDGDALVAEYNASGTMLARYVHGPAQGVDDPIAEYSGSGVAPADRVNLHSDARGSIVLRAPATGGAPSINTYDEYGQPSASNTGRFQYTGQVWLPELGMYYYKARIYSPALGRFMQTDPIGYEDNVNLYGYVGQDPINGVDPTGLFSIRGDPCDVAGGGERATSSCSSSIIVPILSATNFSESNSSSNSSSGEKAGRALGCLLSLGMYFCDNPATTNPSEPSVENPSQEFPNPRTPPPEGPERSPGERSLDPQNNRPQQNTPKNPVETRQAEQGRQRITMPEARRRLNTQAIVREAGRQMARQAGRMLVRRALRSPGVLIICFGVGACAPASASAPAPAQPR